MVFEHFYGATEGGSCGLLKKMTVQGNSRRSRLAGRGAGYIFLRMAAIYGMVLLVRCLFCYECLFALPLLAVLLLLQLRQVARSLLGNGLQV